MPSPIMAYGQLKAIIEEAWADRRVTPYTPPGRRPRRPRSRGEDEPPPERDGSSGWGVYIQYRDSGGDLSERRVTCMKLWRPVGGAGLQVTGFCHECGGIRRFLLDRIAELVDIETGELLSPHDHFEGLRVGGLPFGDEGLEALAKVLVFMLRCDGAEDPREWEALERALASYALRYGSEDSDFERALRICRPLAPDAEDFALALRKFLVAPGDVRKAVAGLVGRACSDVVCADGRIVEAETHWGNAVDSCLRIIRG